MLSAVAAFFTENLLVNIAGGLMVPLILWCIRRPLVKAWDRRRGAVEQRRELAKLRAQDQHEADRNAAAEAQKVAEQRHSTATELRDMTAELLRTLGESGEDAHYDALIALHGAHLPWPVWRIRFTSSLRALEPRTSGLSDAFRQMRDNGFQPVSGQLDLDLEVFLHWVHDVAQAELDSTPNPQPTADVTRVLNRCHSVDAERSEQRQAAIRRAMDEQPVPA